MFELWGSFGRGPSRGLSPAWPHKRRGWTLWIGKHCSWSILLALLVVMRQEAAVLGWHLLLSPKMIPHWQDVPAHPAFPRKLLRRSITA